MPSLLVKMSDGTVLDIAATDVNQIAKHCRAREDYSGKRYDPYIVKPHEHVRWPDGTIHFTDEYRQFFVRSGRIIEMRIMGSKYDNGPWKNPEIGDPKTGRLYSFPLSEETVTTLFGKPDKIDKYSIE